MRVACIGAGIVGLHVARRFAERGAEVFVLDAAPYLAHHTSGRNSGVRHAGLFYEAGSLKEKSCIEGNRLTLEWLEKLKVPHRPCGKWIYPDPNGREALESCYEKIRKLPIPSPEWVSSDRLAAMEPALRSGEAVFVPSTGILDAAEYVKRLAVYLQERGITILLNCHVTGIHQQKLETTRGEIECDLVINSAGLQADEIATMAGLEGYTIKPCRGDYYLLPQAPITRPVYHPPHQEAQGLGVHLTPTLDGQTLVGPNAFFIDDKTDYHHRSGPETFEAAVRYYLPGIDRVALIAGYAGNRPKLFHHDAPVKDFTMIRQGDWIHLLGIESPGLTAAPSLAESAVKLA